VKKEENPSSIVMDLKGPNLANYKKEMGPKFNDIIALNICL
jgi:hypothetical protein